MNPPVQDKEIAAIIERLEKRFPNVPPPEVAAVALEAHDAFNGHPIKTFLPVLVERQAQERLRGRSGEHS
ncbi:three-helix bundle dimerization domain-containing protein [Micromonospora sp. DT81.3]|uniref:three-helix bundle dimerization domain-containing protein n=1 Tax=Actinomycetes TaxID=1760 RepID=UPI003CE7F685